VLASEAFLPKPAKQPGADGLIANLAKKLGFTGVEVPADFPLGLAEGLRRRRLIVKVKAGTYFPERAIKTKAEIEKIRHALQLAERGLARGVEVLRSARIAKDHSLVWAAQPLTSERLRGEIDATIIREGGLPAGTIVAGGNQACDPHERGSGPLRAHEAIIVDIFPRDQRTGYFGDLTRTFVRGKASDALQKLYETVKDGQQWVMGQMKAGVDGGKLHDQLTARFTQAGFPTEQRAGRWGGFFHGTGHSLGLEIHEPPRFSAGKFRVNTVMTVEPGLYYTGLGGVRLEDLVVIRQRGVENLTTAPFEFQI
jgi:Xaa-Pro aminopeptidase